MTQDFQIEFKILLGDDDRDDDWVALDQLIGNSAYIVDFFADAERKHSDFQGGFFIDVDGKPWSDDGAVDEIRMTRTWFDALKKILNGRETAEAHPWEESRLTLKRGGDALEMEDIHYSGRVSLPRVTVPFYEFTAQMLKEGGKALGIIKEIQEEIRKRRAAGVSEQTEAKLVILEENLIGTECWGIEELTEMLESE